MISWGVDLGCQFKWAHSTNVKHSFGEETLPLAAC